MTVVVLTASEQTEDVEKAYDLGTNVFLVKPSSVEELVELLRAMKGFRFRYNVFPGR